MLVLTPSSFTDQDEDDVEQIPFTAVEAEAHGIAICTVEQGIQWLQTQKSISSFPLAILLLEPPPEDIMKKWEVTPLTFTATYKGTGEPMLIYGAFKNLGDGLVKKVIKGNLTKPEIIATQVVKIQAFRDEFQGEWSQLAASPVKILCQAVPLLQLCSGKDCGSGCSKSHSPVDETFDTILMEIWSRTFAKITGGKHDAEDAELF